MVKYVVTPNLTHLDKMVLKKVKMYVFIKLSGTLKIINRLSMNYLQNAYSSGDLRSYPKNWLIWSSDGKSENADTYWNRNA